MCTHNNYSIALDTLFMCSLYVDGITCHYIASHRLSLVHVRNSLIHLHSTLYTIVDVKMSCTVHTLYTVLTNCRCT